MAVLKEPFGRTRNGEDVDKYILRSGELEAEVLTFGATIRRLLAPARSGEPVELRCALPEEFQRQLKRLRERG